MRTADKHFLARVFRDHAEATHHSAHSFDQLFGNFATSCSFSGLLIWLLIIRETRIKPSMQIHSPETVSSVSSIFRSEPVLQSMLCFCWTSGIVYLLGAERLQPELLSELLSGPCDSCGLLDCGFLGSFLAHLLTSSCGFRFRDPTRRGICPVLLKLILSLFRTYSAYACLLTAHCS